MAFDSETLAAELFTGVRNTVLSPAAGAIDRAGDPDPALASTDPDRLLAYLFVTPRACAAVDALLGLRSPA
ncbi:MAG: hypothetical protein JSR45_04105 [Proteobacteria bacterium]|nr:hypothetical protein [Pseudomonadota bacterium]